MCELHVGQQSLLVVPPVLGQGVGPGVLAAGQLQGDLQRVGVDVVEVLEKSKLKLLEQQIQV